MWLTRRVMEQSGVKLSSGEVAGGTEFAVRGESDYQRPETLFPYGFSSLAAQGGRAVMLDGVCAGVSSLPDSALQEGEVRLYSAGGAEILLKQNGDVVINGRVFAPR